MIRFANLDWKPCPFCGKEKIDIKDEESFFETKGSMHLCCTNCSTDVWVFNTYDCTYDEAILKLNTKWNTRGGD